MKDKKQDGEEKILTMNGKKVTPEMQEEMKRRLLEKRAKLDELLKNGEIDGAEYNRRIVDLEVFDDYEIQRRVPIKKRRIIKITLAVLLLILAIPGAIYMNFHFYFQNTLEAEGIELVKLEEETETNAENETETPEASETPQSIKESSLENGPVQIEVVEENGKKESGKYKGRNIDISYKDYYDITGIVTSVRDFWGLDDYAALVPRDVCLAWGSLAQTFLDDGATFYQQYRYCHGKATGENAEMAETFDFKTPFGKIQSSLALMSNNHLIASDVDIRNQIASLKTKDKIRIKGYLVNVTYNDRLSLRTSEKRDDAGNGACEVIYVTSIENFGQENTNKQ